MSASPTWRTGADAPSASPPRMTRNSPGLGRQSSSTIPATSSASNSTSGMIVCSAFSW